LMCEVCSLILNITKSSLFLQNKCCYIQGARGAIFGYVRIGAARWNLIGSWNHHIGRQQSRQYLPTDLPNHSIHVVRVERSNRSWAMRNWSIDFVWRRTLINRIRYMCLWFLIVTFLKIYLQLFDNQNRT